MPMTSHDNSPTCPKCGHLIPYDIFNPGLPYVPSHTLRGVIVGAVIGADGRTVKPGQPYHRECIPDAEKPAPA